MQRSLHRLVTYVQQKLSPLLLTSSDQAGNLEFAVTTCSCLLWNLEAVLEIEPRCRSASEAAPGRNVEWAVSGAQSVQRVWDVTDPQMPRAIPHDVLDGTLSFRVAYDSVRRFRAGTGSGFYVPVPIGPVQNTDVHALPQVDLVVITCLLYTSPSPRD